MGMEMEMEGAQELPQANPDGRTKSRLYLRTFLAENPASYTMASNVRVPEHLVMGKGF